MERFDITGTQAEAILDLKLRHLAKLEEVKIRGEQSELDEERQSLETVLGSKARLRTMVKKELIADAEAYGDERRSRLVERDAAQAFREEDLVPSEPVTVVLSKSGWVRAAKGHEMDATTLNYRAGDEYLNAARGRSNEQAVFLDSTGRAYALPAHSLPSARSLGEPLTSRFNVPPGARFIATLSGPADQKVVLASTFGYGFVTKLENLHSRMKAGKAMITLPKGSEPVLPAILSSEKDATVVCATSEGHLLAFPLSELPELAKGKGNKLINVPPKRLKAGDEWMVGVAVKAPGEEILVWAGQRYLRLAEKDLEHYRGDRAKRGRKLPRGFQRVTLLEIATD